jgi:MYXO-CTERM domain-containing protein
LPGITNPQAKTLGLEYAGQSPAHMLHLTAQSPDNNAQPRGASRWFAAGIGLFWLGFYLAYPYRELIDDSGAKLVLSNQFLTTGSPRLARIVHQALLYLQGLCFERSMPKAMVLGILLHLLVGWLLWKKLIPRLAEKLRPLAEIGLVGFMVHPVALQTTVHVAQRSEILGALLLVLALWLVLAVRASALSPKHLLALAGLAVLALLCKEAYLVAILALPLLWISERPVAQIRRRVLILFAALCLLAAGRSGLGGTHELGPDAADAHRRTAAYERSFASGQPVAASESILFPARTRLQNLRTQVAVLPILARAVLVPFSLVKDAGFFPYGRSGSGWGQPWFYLGLGLLVLAGLAARRVWRRWGLHSAVVFLLPAFLFATYWLVPLADAVVLYRLYGVVLLATCLSLPIALQGVPKARTIMVAILALAVVAGSVRSWEMANPVREAKLEVARAPDNYRVYITYLHALMDSGARPVDCHAVMDPALARAPSTAFVYVELAWCLWNQKRTDEARTYARLALEQEVVPENLHPMLDMLIGTQGQSVFLDKLHPANLQRLNQGQSPR